MRLRADSPQFPKENFQHSFGYAQNAADINYSTFLCSEFIYKNDFKKAEIKYRSNAEKQLFDEYFEETGVLLNYSLKGQHNEYLESQTGHFYDAEHSAYFVGMPKGGFKFSRGQFNHVRFLDGPDYLKKKCVELTATYYVRNKSATVLPFPFKTLAECVLDRK
ncbi:hypothetical protein [Algibacillus agarilyticus]|uniref:hypothetical protein n=1 Tax=Algibacillus agarilyticus TaxID=2234133 RepID=UPI001E5760C2|nr:hypothetical protein [Algibacillus agarilyticus]